MPSDKDTNIEILKDRVHRFVDERDWSKYHNPKDVAISISIEASELLELFQWTKEEEAKSILSNSEKKAKLAAELSDIIIYCLSLANVAQIDVSQSIFNKISANEKKYPVEKIKGNYKKYTEI